MEKLALLLLLLLLIPLCSAQVFINEILPDPTDDCTDCTEWVELYNSGGEDVDVVNWTLRDSKDRYLKIIEEYTETGSTLIAANGYLVIYPGKEGQKRYIYLTNKADTVKLFEGEESVDEVSYSGFNKDYDQAWARQPDGSDNWIKTEPTRGDSNSASEPAQSDEQDSDQQAEAEQEDIPASDSEDTASEDSSDSEEEQASQPKATEKPKAAEKKAGSDGEKVTGKTVYINEDKPALSKVMLIMLIVLVVIIVFLIATLVI